MDIVENLEQWTAKFESTWLAHLRKTGERDFANLYPSARNRHVEGVKGIDLSKSRLMFVSSAGGDLKDKQEPFNETDSEGDYSIRTFGNDIAFEQLDYAHFAYDKVDVRKDPNVLLPFDHLREMVDSGEIGELAPTIVSFMGYQPHLGRLVEETIPPIIEIAKKEKVDGALLVPS